MLKAHPARHHLLPHPSCTGCGLSASLQKLRPQHTLALVLLACWQQGEAASPLDVVRWALDGHLPYLAFPAEEGAALQQFSAILGRRLVTPRGEASTAACALQSQDMLFAQGVAYLSNCNRCTGFETWSCTFFSICASLMHRSAHASELYSVVVL